MTAFRIEKLARHHDVDGFDCGSEALNRFLIRFALNSQLAHASQTYLGLADDAVAGFHTLVVGEVQIEDAPERLKKGLPRHPVPIMVLARLAVHKDWQGKGVGAGLLKDAVLRTLAAADIAGIRALVVHAKDDAARAFYVRYGFSPGFSDPLHLHILTKDLKALLD
ncbi:GNAT family N-acetyltransferase [Aestuariivirga sp.]|uniref:GNAT family N-acetyltransferase n=1 Tax=Aestuariivirga sp. TaxID=2650926 RepID=UPI0035945A59